MVGASINLSEIVLKSLEYDSQIYIFDRNGINKRSLCRWLLFVGK